MAQPTMIEPQVHDLIKQLIAQQMECIAKGSLLRREQKALGDLKKERDGTIAELMRLEVNLTNMELPFGLEVDEKGYVVAGDGETETGEEE